MHLFIVEFRKVSRKGGQRELQGSSICNANIAQELARGHEVPQGLVRGSSGTDIHLVVCAHDVMVEQISAAVWLVAGLGRCSLVALNRPTLTAQQEAAAHN